MLAGDKMGNGRCHRYQFNYSHELKDAFYDFFRNIQQKLTKVVFF